MSNLSVAVLVTALALSSISCQSPNGVLRSEQTNAELREVRAKLSAIEEQLKELRSTQNRKSTPYVVGTRV